MKCPHCLITIHRQTSRNEVVSLDVKEDDRTFRVFWKTEHQFCPECHKLIIWLVYSKHEIDRESKGLKLIDQSERIVFPGRTVRNPPSPLVPKEFVEDYVEASLVLDLSLKASAAISRCCLQNIIHTQAKIVKDNLYDEIEELVSSKSLPSFINDQLHAVRVIGNFAAHPMKSKTTGQIIDVEPGEAEWNLDVVESLFDFYFVLSHSAKQKKDRINIKLREAGKKEI